MAISPETTEVLRRKGLLSMEELAEFLGVPLATVRKWRAIGTAPRAYRVGRHVRFDPQDVARWLEAQADPKRVA